MWKQEETKAGGPLMSPASGYSNTPVLPPPENPDALFWDLINAIVRKIGGSCECHSALWVLWNAGGRIYPKHVARGPVTILEEHQKVLVFFIMFFI